MLNSSRNTEVVVHNKVGPFLRITVYFLFYQLFVQLSGSDICRQHCAVEYVNGVVVIMPLDRAAAVHVDNSRIYSATPLSHDASVLVGSRHFFQFVDPMTVQVS